MSALLSRSEFEKKLRFNTVDSQEPSYASGGMSNGTYASGGYEIVEAWFNQELIATNKISFNPMFEAIDKARLAAVVKNLWRKHGDRPHECDYEQYLPPHDTPCGRAAEIFVQTNEAYKLFFCESHADRGIRFAIAKGICATGSLPCLISATPAQSEAK